MSKFMRKAYAVVHHAKVNVMIREPWDNGEARILQH